MGDAGALSACEYLKPVGAAVCRTQRDRAAVWALDIEIDLSLGLY